MRKCKRPATTLKKYPNCTNLLATTAASALDQQDEAAEAGIGMTQFLYGNCRHRDVLEIGDNILRGQTDRLRPETLVHVWILMGSTIYCLGDFQTCSPTRKGRWRPMTGCIALTGLPGRCRPGHRRPRLCRDGFTSFWRSARSLSVSEQCIAIALERGHPFSIVWASVCRIVALAGFGLYAEAVACADRAIAICEKHGFDTRIGNVLFHRGLSLFELGEQRRGLADLQRGVAQWREQNGIFFLARNLAKLAEYQLRANQLEQARANLGEAERRSKPLKRRIIWRKSVGCVAASFRRRRITARLAFALSAPSPNHAGREPAVRTQRRP